MKTRLDKWRSCQRCFLCYYRRNVVLGRGSLPADFLFIGEAPGKSEDLLGEPFRGPSGRLLETALSDAAKIAGRGSRGNLRVFITNVVACRPTNSKQGENREPTPEEALACWDRLELTYLLARPKRIVFLGKVAERFCKVAWPDGISVPHPSFILRQGGVSAGIYPGYVRAFAEIIRS